MAPYVEWFSPRTFSLPSSDTQRMSRKLASDDPGKVRVSRPIVEKSENEIQKEKENMEMAIKSARHCKECDYYKKLIEFYHNIFIVLIGGFVIKLLLDSILQAKRS